MFVLWYCHKRGREVRLEQEKAEAEAAAAVDGADRVEELADDPQLPAGESAEATKEANPETEGDAETTVKAIEPAPTAADPLEFTRRRTDSNLPAHA